MPSGRSSRRNFLSTWRIVSGPPTPTSNQPDRNQSHENGAQRQRMARRPVRHHRARRLRAYEDSRAGNGFRVAQRKSRLENSLFGGRVSRYSAMVGNSTRKGGRGDYARAKTATRLRRGHRIAATSLDGFKSRLATGRSLLPCRDERMPAITSLV